MKTMRQKNAMFKKSKKYTSKKKQRRCEGLGGGDRTAAEGQNIKAKLRSVTKAIFEIVSEDLNINPVDRKIQTPVGNGISRS